MQCRSYEREEIEGRKEGVMEGRCKESKGRGGGKDQKEERKEMWQEKELRNECRVKEGKGRSKGRNRGNEGRKG